MMWRCSVDYDQDFFLRYSKMAGALNLDEINDIEKARRRVAEHLGEDLYSLSEKIAPLESLYALADHTRSLVFGFTKAHGSILSL
jgi:alanyl-tRNA synthetase